MYIRSELPTFFVNNTYTAEFPDLIHFSGMNSNESFDKSCFSLPAKLNFFEQELNSHAKPQRTCGVADNLGPIRLQQTDAEAKRRKPVFCSSISWN